MPHLHVTWIARGVRRATPGDSRGVALPDLLACNLFLFQTAVLCGVARGSRPTALFGLPRPPWCVCVPGPRRRTAPLEHLHHTRARAAARDGEREVAALGEQPYTVRLLPPRSAPLRRRRGGHPHVASLDMDVAAPRARCLARAWRRRRGPALAWARQRGPAGSPAARENSENAQSDALKAGWAGGLRRGRREAWMLSGDTFSACEIIECGI